MDKLELVYAIQKATKVFKKDTGLPYAGTSVEDGKIIVNICEFSPRGKATVVPISEWYPVEQFAEAFAEAYEALGFA
jgi:hypothetical protein